MTRSATITRDLTLRLTALAVVVFVVLCWLFADGLLWPWPLWNGASWVDSPLITYLLILVMLWAGSRQARRLPAQGLTLTYPDESAGTPGQVSEPLVSKLLFGNVLVSFLWLPLRFFLGRDWLSAGLHKVGNPAWTDNGQALAGFWKSAVAVNDAGSGPVTYDWYRRFLQYMLDHQWYTWFAKVVVWGEILIGLGLLVGALVGLAAFFGTFLNLNFGLAGTASSNPILFALGALLVLAWRTAGWWGLDRWLLPRLGTPWQSGDEFEAAFRVEPEPEPGPVVGPYAGSAPYRKKKRRWGV